MAIFITLAAAIAAVLVAGSIAETLRSYDRLPERVPLHFGLDGSIDTYGPRFMVWSMVVVQIAIAALFAGIIALFLSQGLPARVSVAMAGFGDVMILMLWRAQRLIIETALSGQDRADLRAFWWLFGATMLCAIGLVTIVSR